MTPRDNLAARVAAAQAMATREHPLHRELRAARSWYETAGGAVAAGMVDRAAEAWRAAGCPETESAADFELVTLAALVTDLWAEVEKERAEVARLRAQLPAAGPTWGEHCAGLGDDLPSVRDRILSAIATEPNPKPGTEADIVADAALPVRGTTTTKRN